MTPPFTHRRFDAVVSRLYALGVLDGEDLVLLHRLPWRERVHYLVARAQAAVEESLCAAGAETSAQRSARLKRSVEGWT